VRLAVEELNPPVRSGVAGRPLAVISCDSGADPLAAKELASRLVRSVPAIISDGSAETLQIAEATIPAGVLLMAGASTSPELTALPDASPDGSVGLVWRTTPSDVYQGDVLATRMIAEEARDGVYPRVAVLTRDDVYGQGLFAAFADRYLGEATAFLFPPGGDVAHALASAAAFLPDSVLVIGFPEEVVPLIDGARSHAPLTTARWSFTQGARFPELFASVVEPERLQGARGTSPAFANYGSAAYRWFLPQFAGSYGEYASSVVDVTHMFDATMLVAAAADVLLSSGRDVDGTALASLLTRVSDRSLVPLPLDPPHFKQITASLEAVDSTVNVEGASGQLDFDAATGEAKGDIEVWVILDGAFRTIEIVTP
jgi:branched-chain amino acid transport system substrate-binding protein